MDRMQGVVFNIQKFTIHDGPGIRTSVFLKGCPLSCKWCSNPEGINPKQELGIYPNKCIGYDKCGLCAKACPLADKTPLRFSKNAISCVDRSVCGNCLECGKSCNSGGIRIWGKNMTASEVMREVLADRAFFSKSGGGVTLNGGEVAAQWEFAVEILRECRRHQINTCVESSLFCAPDILDEFYSLTDLLITDIKHMDPVIHSKYTGADNSLILRNLIRTIEAGVPTVVRIPIIPGINDDRENVIKTAEFIYENLYNRVVQVQLMPYRKLGIEKYGSLGIIYPMGQDYEAPEKGNFEKSILELAELMRAHGVQAAVGSDGSI